MNKKKLFWIIPVILVPTLFIIYFMILEFVPGYADYNDYESTLSRYYHISIPKKYKKECFYKVSNDSSFIYYAEYSYDETTSITDNHKFGKNDRIEEYINNNVLNIESDFYIKDSNIDLLDEHLIMYDEEYNPIDDLDLSIWVAIIVFPDNQKIVVINHLLYR